MLAKTVTEAARFVAERGVIKEGAPILLKFVTQVAARFGVVVTQKVAAQALPVSGALGGAAVNYAFSISKKWRAGTSPCGGALRLIPSIPVERSGKYWIPSEIHALSALRRRRSKSYPT
jgi:hypothetical protein